MKKLHGMIILTLAFMALVVPFAHMAPAANWYVATNGTGGGTSWADATNSIQGAIDASSAGETVWVSNGVYEAGGTNGYPSGTVLTNRIAIYKAITVQAFSTNPADTVIKGAWDPATNGPAAVRCVWMTNGSTLIGFTLTNGATFVSGVNVERGGGVSCQSTNTVISNCVLTGNSAGVYGGGAMYGTLFNCTLAGNSAYNGGGVYGAPLFNCTLTGNSAGFNGGGAYLSSILSNCTIVGNTATNFGGGVYANPTIFYNCTLTGNSATNFGGGLYSSPAASTMYNCTLTSNSVTGYNKSAGGVYYAIMYNCTLTGNSAGPGNGSARGGGAYAVWMYNCTIVSNRAPGGDGGGVEIGYLLNNCTIVGNYCKYYGGGAKQSTLYNCTLVGNWASSGPGGAEGGTLYNCTVVGNWGGANGGGVRSSTLINSIVYFNGASSGSYSNWNAVVAFTNTCTAPAATNGVGNITSDPTFIANGSAYGTNHVAGNYRLRNVSPPLNAGTNLSYMTDPNDVRSKDLDGLRRIDRFSGQVDMGCYELMPRGTMFIMK